MREDGGEIQLALENKLPKLNYNKVSAFYYFSLSLDPKGGHNTVYLTTKIDISNK